jgi:hypothetical protein
VVRDFSGVFLPKIVRDSLNLFRGSYVLELVGSNVFSQNVVHFLLRIVESLVISELSLNECVQKTSLWKEYREESKQIIAAFRKI